VPGGLASFRWAVFGQAPPDGAAGGPWDFLPDVTNPDPNAANPDDRRCGSAKGGLAVRMSAGVKFPDPEPPPTPSPSPPPGLPPLAAVTIPSGPPTSGMPVTLNASGSLPSPGATIIAYRWDFNGDGHVDTNTGANPIAHLIPGSQAQTVIVTVVDSSFHTDSVTTQFQPGPSGGGGCESELEAGTLRARAACIRREGQIYTMEPGAIAGSTTREVSVNGLTLTTTDPDGRVIVNRRTGRITSRGAFAVVISNTPIGDITLNRSGPEGINWRLPSDARAAAAQVDFSDDETDPINQDTGPVVRLVTFGAGEGCNNSERQRRACGELPGGFPLTGRIDVGFDTSNYQAVITANVAISTPFTVTGMVRLRVDLNEGFLLDTLGFGIGNVTIGPLLLERLGFVYEPPGGGDPAHVGDLWDVRMAVGLGTVPRLFVDGRIIFIGGRFNYGSADITLPVGIPIYAGVLLNRFAGTIGIDPTRLGGGLGIQVIQLLQINADFLYTRRDSGLVALRGDGTIAISGQNIGRAYMEYWTDGYFAFGGILGYGYPSLAHPTVAISGATDFYIESQPGGGYRSQGDGRMDLTIVGLHAVVRMFFNNDWAAACLELPISGIAGAHNLRTGVTESAIGCDLSPYAIEPSRPRPSGRPSRLAHSAQAAPDGRTFTVANGERALVLSVKGAGGAPQLVLIGPDGHRYVPTSDPAKVAGDAKFKSVFLPEGNVVLLRVEHPAAGDWALEPQPGSPAIASVKSATALPELKLAAKVSGKGRTRTLTWNATGLAGRSVRFVERGKNVGQTIVTTRKAHGRASYTLQDGSAGPRTIEAEVTSGALTMAAPVVARYRAAGPARPTRPGKVRVTRKREKVTVRWGKAAKADGYVVRITGNNGRREEFRASAKRRRTRIFAVAATTRLKITVRAWRGSPANRSAGRTAVSRATAKR
jgi:hypothetical protein